jgi:hypothetical protein
LDFCDTWLKPEEGGGAAICRVRGKTKEVIWKEQSTSSTKATNATLFFTFQRDAFNCPNHNSNEAITTSPFLPGSSSYDRYNSQSTCLFFT